MDIDKSELFRIRIDSKQLKEACNNQKVDIGNVLEIEELIKKMIQGNTGEYIDMVTVEKWINKEEE